MNDDAPEAWIWRDGDDWYRLRFDFDRAVVDGIKRAVPAGHRRYDPELREWSVWFAHLGRVKQVLREQGFRVYERGEPAALGGSNGDAWATLYLAPNAPPYVVDAAYRALAKANHPDVGGDAEIMKRINNAYDQVKEGE